MNSSIWKIKLQINFNPTKSQEHISKETIQIIQGEGRLPATVSREGRALPCKPIGTAVVLQARSGEWVLEADRVTLGLHEMMALLHTAYRVPRRSLSLGHDKIQLETDNLPPCAWSVLSTVPYFHILKF